MKRLLYALAVILGLLILMTAVSLYFLPDIAGSNRAKKMLESNLSETLNRPFHIRRLQWGWQNGLEIHGLEIVDDPKFSGNPLIFITHAGLKIDYSALIKKQLRFVLFVSDAKLNIIRDIQGRVNFTEAFSTKPTAQKAQPAKKLPAPEKKQKAFVLPLDISAAIHIDGIFISCNDLGRQQRFTIKNASIRLDAPSLKNDPATLAIRLDPFIDQHKLPHSTLTAKVEHLFNTDGALSMNSLAFTMDLNLPGTRAEFSGDMARSGITGKARVDLAASLKAAAPLIPDIADKISIAGDISLFASISGKPDEPIVFNTTLDAGGVALSGDLLQGKSLASGNLGLHVQGTFNQKNQSLLIKNGELTFLNNSRVQLSGSIKQLNSDSPFADFSIAPLTVDLDEATNFFQKFLPSRLTIGQPGQKSLLGIDLLRLSGNLPDGPADIRLDGFKLKLPRIRFLGAKNSITISGINLKRLTAEAQGIRKTKKSPFGIEADITLAEALTIKQIRIPGQADIGLNQSFSGHTALHPDGTAKGSINNLDLSLLVSQFNKKIFGPVDSVCKTDITIRNFKLAGVDPPSININKLDAGINIDDTLLAHMKAEVVDSGRSRLNTQTEITADLCQLSEKYLKKMLPGISATGKARITINSKGRLPSARQIDQLKSLLFSGNLGFLEVLDIEARLKAASLKLARNDTNPIWIPSISGEPAIHYHLTGKNGIGRLDSRLQIRDVKDIPVLQPRRPLSADIFFDASHNFLDSVDLHQRLTVTPSGINEKAEISVDGLDKALTKKTLPPLLWLLSTGVTADANIDIPDCERLKTTGIPGMADMDIDGSISSSVRIQVVPDRSITGDLKFVLNRMNLEIQNAMTIRDIHGDIDLSKRYGVMPGTDTDRAANDALMLSQQVIQPAFSAYSVTPSGNSRLNRQLGTLNNRNRITPDLSVGPARFQSLPFPLVVDGTRIMLSLKGGLPNLDYFQMEVLGGTINGSVFLYKAQADFFLESAINFSGINTALIFPDAFSGVSGTEAEISGFFYAKIPVTDRLRPLLEDAAITIAFTHIGSRALERILYALDPRESNEAIVSQRLLLKTGTPRRVRLTLTDGFLSLTGEVSIKSIAIPLPPLQRLNISRLPGIERFGANLRAVGPIVSILKVLSAQRLIVNKENPMIRFK